MWTAIICAILGSQTVTFIVQWLIGKLDKRDNPIRHGVEGTALLQACAL